MAAREEKHVDKAVQIKLIHGLCDFWKRYFRYLFKEGAASYELDNRQPHFADGFRPHHRREAPILAVRVVNHRSCRVGLSCLNASYDMSNAFASSSLTVLQEACDEIVADTDWLLFEARRKRHFISVTACDGIAEGLLGEGGLMGDKSVLSRIVNSWRNRPPCKDDRNGIVCSFAGQTYDATVWSYADDIWKIFLLFHDGLEEALKLIDVGNQSLDTLLHPQYKQKRTSKQLSQTCGRVWSIGFFLQTSA